MKKSEMDKSVIHKFVLLLAAICSTFSVSAYDFEVDGIYYDKISDTSVEVTHDGSLYDDNNDAGYSGNVTIPETIEIDGITYFVCGIGRNAFSYCDGLTSVAIPASVTSIGEGAFNGCTGMTSVAISASVTSIGESAFYGCTSLASVNIPEGITSIGDFAFGDCTGLTSVTIPASVISIGESAFYGCTSLTEIIINENNPNYVSIDGVLFNKTYTELILYPAGKAGIYTIPEGITSISVYAFGGCTGLTSVTIPASVTSIAMFAFYDCTALTEIIVNENNPNYASIDGVLFNKTYTELIHYPAGKAGIYNIPTSVTSIGDCAFSGCISLTSVSIPDSVTSIGSSAFDECTGLTSVSIPASVTSIRGGIFSGCTGLTSVSFPDGVTSIGPFELNGCISLNRIIFFAETVPTFDFGVFAKVPTTCSIYVPSGTRDSYASADELAPYTIKEFGITVTPAEVTLKVDATAELTASYTVDGAAETETEISSVLGSEFIWSSSAENVAAVSTSGQVTARNAGTAEIMATTRFGNTVFATSTVNVGTSGILDVSADGIKISATSGKIIVENIGENQKVSAYTIDGVGQILKVSKDGTVEIPAETGRIYIIVVDGFATKILAK